MASSDKRRAGIPAYQARVKELQQQRGWSRKEAMDFLRTPSKPMGLEDIQGNIYNRVQFLQETIQGLRAALEKHQDELGQLVRAADALGMDYDNELLPATAGAMAGASVG